MVGEVKDKCNSTNGSRLAQQAIAAASALSLLLACIEWQGRARVCAFCPLRCFLFARNSFKISRELHDWEENAYAQA